MKLQKKYKKYYIILSVLCIFFLVGIVAGYKIFLQEPTYLYIKMKVNQGLWWATTEKPPFWYTKAIQKGDTAYDFLGNPEAEILDKRSYLRSEGDVFDIYLTIKIKVNKQAAPYTYNRSVIAVGTPLELQFSYETVSGTIIEVHKNMPSEKMIQKTIHLTKPNVYNWEYDAIQLGETISDGKHTILEIVDKKREGTPPMITDANGTIILNTSEQSGATLTAKIWVKEGEGIYILGEEKIIHQGRPLDISLPSLVLKDFIVSKIE